MIFLLLHVEMRPSLEYVECHSVPSVDKYKEDLYIALAQPVNIRNISYGYRLPRLR
jgi:hypothetical protein